MRGQQNIKYETSHFSVLINFSTYLTMDHGTVTYSCYINKE